MQSSWPKAIGWIFEWEGSDVNISAGEPGGISKYGVSLGTYREHCAKHGLPEPSFDDIKNMTADQASAFYRTAFANFIHFDDLPVGVDYRLLDVTIQLGLGGGPKLFASRLGQWATADMAVLASIARTINDTKALALSIGDGWIAIKSQSPTWLDYTDDHGVKQRGHGHGWTNRNVAANTNALSLIGATS